MLAADFAKLSPAMLAAAAPQELRAALIDRLVANMSKVVKVTPVGEVAGDDPAALVSQIGAALERGQIAPAMAAWARLPEAARQASSNGRKRRNRGLPPTKRRKRFLTMRMTRLAAAKN